MSKTWVCSLPGYAIRYLIDSIKNTNIEGKMEIYPGGILYCKSNKINTVTNMFEIYANNCTSWTFTFPAPFEYGFNVSEFALRLKRFTRGDSIELSVIGDDDMKIRIIHGKTKKDLLDQDTEMTLPRIHVDQLLYRIPSEIGPPTPPNVILTSEQATKTFGAIKQGKDGNTIIRGYQQGIVFVQENGTGTRFGEVGLEGMKIGWLAPPAPAASAAGEGPAEAAGGEGPAGEAAVTIVPFPRPIVNMVVDYKTIIAFKAFKNISAEDSDKYVNFFFGKIGGKDIIRIDVPISTIGRYVVLLRSIVD